MKRSIGTKLTLLSLAICSSIALGHDGNGGSSDDWSRARNSIVIDLPNTTQGPPWPPAEVVDENGNFILVGNLLRKNESGVVGLVPRQAVIVSKETVPPLDANGVEDLDNLFGAPHKVIRRLNLRKGSPDLDIVLHSVSFGPTVGSGRTPRMPRIGESTYNLNGDPIPCPDSFPSTVQTTNYFRPSYPLHQVPIAGFQGDGVAYDIETGESYDPMTASNLPSCMGRGCPGEDAVDARRTKPITLGEWLEADGKLRITLIKPNRRGQFTAARFNFEMRDMLANSIFSVWTIRVRQTPMPGRERRATDPLHNPNIFVTDSNGRATFEWEVGNPFPDAATDTRGMRIIGLAVVYHADQQNWGACFSRFGPGVDVHAVFNTLNTEAAVPGTLPDMTNFITVAR